jgi:hypothetical protein
LDAPFLPVNSCWSGSANAVPSVDSLRGLTL